MDDTNQQPGPRVQLLVDGKEVDISKRTHIFFVRGDEESVCQVGKRSDEQLWHALSVILHQTRVHYQTLNKPEALKTWERGKNALIFNLQTNMTTLDQKSNNPPKP